MSSCHALECVVEGCLRNMVGVVCTAIRLDGRRVKSGQVQLCPAARVRCDRFIQTLRLWWSPRKLHICQLHFTTMKPLDNQEHGQEIRIAEHIRQAQTMMAMCIEMCLVRILLGSA